MVNYFGESSKTTPPSVFFPVFVRFIRAYKVRKDQTTHISYRDHMDVTGHLANTVIQSELLESEFIHVGCVCDPCRK